MFRFAIVGWKAEQYISRCLLSVTKQDIPDWTACVVLDPAEDATVKLAQEFAKRDSRVKVIANDKQMYSIPNIIRAIAEQQPEDEDIIAILDADDWLTNNESLDIVKICYDSNPETLVTHGSWVSYPAPEVVTNNGAYTDEDWIKGIRKVDWRASHFRTFKYKIWRHVDHKYLKTSDGEYIRVAGDLAIMYPLLEMCGKHRVRYIPEKIYTYNQETPCSDSKIRLKEQMDMADYIAGMSPCVYLENFNTVTVRGSSFSDLDILFLTKEIPDYLHDMLFYGLRELGCNIEDYPRKMSLHGVPHPSEFHTEQLLLTLDSRSLRKQPDIMVVTALSHDYNPKGPVWWNDFVMECEARYKPKKIVVLDGMDRAAYFYPSIIGSYRTIFKRELVKPYPGPDWFPINFASMPEPFKFVPFKQRAYDLCYIATISCEQRVWVRDYLKNKASTLGLKICMHIDKRQIPRNEYLDILSQSRCALSVRGMGFDCYRYWEIPAKGSVLVADRLPIDILNDYVENVHCFKYSGFEYVSEESGVDLDRVLKKIRDTPIERLEYMALQALLHTQTFHTCEKRAEYFINTIYR